MNEQFDDDLEKRIREVFETHESTGADEGWLLLREKFPEKKRNRKAIIWFWYSAAAILLLFLGFGVWEINKKIQPQNFVSGKSKQGDKTDPTAVVKIDVHNNKAKSNTGSVSETRVNSRGPVTKTSNQNIITTTRSSSLGTLNAATRSPSGTRSRKSNQSQLINNQRITNGPLSKSKNLVKIKTANKIHKQNHNHNDLALSASKNGKNKDLLETPPADGDSTIDDDIADNKTDKVIPTDNQAVGQKLIANSDTVVTMAKAEVKVETQPKKSINTMFAEDQKKAEQKSAEKNKKIRFGIYEATYFNYAKGSSNNVNIGAGLTANINIAKNLELVAGLAVGQNTLTFDNNIPVASQTYLTSATSFSPNSLGHSVTALPFAYFSPATTVKNYSAGLVGLDVPLNLKYALNSRKNSIYISAGFSSGTFISESYNYQYYYSASSSPYLQQTQQQSTNKNFNSFYFAKTLNLSFGEGLPFGKNAIIIEPFLKYPVGGLGSQDIHFGAGGVNLKFNLQNPKK